MTILPSTQIDRASPVPFYFQLAGLLEHEIVRLRWQPGDRLPSEAELCGRFELSRTTVRQALARLEQEGLVVRRKGFGTFVASASPRMWLLQSQEGFFQDEVTRMGRAVSSEILSRRGGRAPHWAADALGLPQGAEGVVMERLRSVDGKLALCVTDCLPAAQAGVVMDMDGTQSLTSGCARSTVSRLPAGAASSRPSPRQATRPPARRTPGRAPDVHRVRLVGRHDAPVPQLSPMAANPPHAGRDPGQHGAGARPPGPQSAPTPTTQLA